MKRLGFAALECNVRFVEPELARSDDAIAEINRAGLAFYCAHTESSRPLDELRQKADVAAKFGAKCLAVNGVPNRPLRTERPDEEAVRAKVEKLSSLGAYCRKAGVRLVYHNHTDEFVADGFEIQEIIRRTDPGHLSLLLDIGFPPPGKSVVPEFFSTHFARVDGMHLHDMRDPKPPIYDLVAARIEKAGWSGHLILEEAANKSDTDIEVVLSANRRIIQHTFDA
jgi:sugar phosphate isomerase/epimerase